MILRSGRRGLTLSETLVAASLTVVLGLVMVKLLSSGLGAHSKGAQSRDAQAGVRSVLSLLVAELRSSAAPPLTDPSPVTPVFWPSVWGSTQELSIPPEYPREIQDHANGKDKIDTATNRLVYVRAREDDISGVVAPLDAYVLVELVVPPDQPNVIQRKIYSPTQLRNFLELHDVEGAGGAKTPGWLLNIGALDSATPSGSPEVAYDAGKDARVSFKVSHLTFAPAGDPGRTRYPQIYEPGVFRFEVAVAVQAETANATTAPWPQKNEWSTIREESTEIRIPSVRQN